MKKILAILMLLMLNLNIALAQNLEIDETNLSEKDIQYLSAWTSLAIFDKNKKRCYYASIYL